MPSDGSARIEQLLTTQHYIADPTIAMSIYLAQTLHKPLLVEGPAGVGMTEIAKVLAKALSVDLIRLQCYEGLDTHTALYEWNYQRQLLQLRLNDGQRSLAEREADIFSEEFLLKRPLFEAISREVAPVLLIDELDRADEEFESFLLEVLAEWQTGGLPLVKGATPTTSHWQGRPTPPLSVALMPTPE